MMEKKGEIGIEIQRNIAEVIRAFKEKRGKSLSEFSEELEISRSSLQSYLAGTGNPNIETILHLAEKLGVDPIFLITNGLSATQINILYKMLDVTEEAAKLPPERRKRFAELLAEVLQLWDGEAEADEEVVCESARAGS